MRAWLPSGDNTEIASGRLLVGGRPVSGARISVDRYVLKQATGPDGRFRAAVDVNGVRRHVVKVADLSRARVGGRALTPSERAAARAASGGFSVAYRINDLKASSGKNGNVVVTGRISTRGGFAPAGVEPVHLPALGPDHRRGRAAGRRRDRRHAHRRPRLLDVLGALGRERELHVLLRRIGQVAGRSGAAQRPGRARLGLVLVGPGPDGQVQAAPERTHGRAAAGPRRRRRCRCRPRPRTPAPSIRGCSSERTSTDASSSRSPRSGPTRRAGSGSCCPPSTRGKTVRLWQSSFQAFATFPARPGGAVDLKHLAEGPLAARLDRHRERAPARLATEALPGVSRAGL